MTDEATSSCRLDGETRLVKPVRVQLSRKKGYRKPENCVVVSRPSKWGNGFRAYLDLIFLVQEAPSILGERSNLGGTISALNSGGPGQSVDNSWDHLEHIQKRIDQITKVRRLYRIWQRLDPETRLILDVYYTPRVRWPSGFDAFIGSDFASVALAFPPDDDRAALEEACKGASKKKHEVLIQRAITRAKKLVKGAHEEWDRVRRIAEPHVPRKSRWSPDRARSLADFEAEVAA